MHKQLRSATDDPQLTLPAIPVIETGRDFPLKTLMHFKARAHDLFDIATRRYPPRLLKGLDKVSRAWLKRHANAHLEEIDTIAGVLGRPGAYFFSINYEWGCTCRVAPCSDGGARLIRVLDWLTPGLGRNLVCARVTGAAAGPFVVLTWPGYSGVLQVMAPQRFSAALNQAPMRKTSGLYYLDWASGRRRVWGLQHATPAHLLRSVSETAADFGAACDALCRTPIAAPCIFSIAGTASGETAVIERTESEFRLRRGGSQVAANHWESAHWQGHARGLDSPGRARMMTGVAPEFDGSFSWLAPPILNERTRLAFIADARAGRLMGRGYEAERAATQTLDLFWRISN